MMDTILERGNFVQAFQRQLNDELAREQALPQPAHLPTLNNTAERVTLRDGATLTVRPVRLEDVHLLWEMHRRLSTTTLYYRYLSAYAPRLTELAHICNINDETGGALVAVTGRLHKQIVAVAYYLKNEQRPDTGEIAFLVEDRFQGRGLGHILWRQITEHGRERGMTAWEAYVHPDNAAMLRLIHKSGLPVIDQMVYDLRKMRVQLKKCS
jgi:RimJ/RimL family protein N-acetyltransferase